MRLAEQDEVVVIGYAVRTHNADEADPARARIPGLWQRATAPGAFDGVEGRRDQRLYAVLTGYESDHHGAYTQIVGVAVTESAAVPGGMATARVPAGKYLLVEARGAMPAALIEAWATAWRHTESGATPPRAFTTDLEIHHEEGADLYLATA
ncbi:GyrI-like domain-containing protein [Actinoplanes sp. NPDC000266]